MTIKQINRSAADLLTAREAAKLLPSTSAQTILRWAREGSIPAVRLPSGRVFFSKVDVLAMLEPVSASDEEVDVQQELPFDELSSPRG